jgi:hypothetical protein
MEKNLLLVDFENVQKIDLSLLDDSFWAIIFVGQFQKQPRLKGQTDHKNKFRRLDFQKIEGHGKNALDFHIAFELGRVFETEPDINCIVLSRDKGFDPLLQFLNKKGLKCQRIDSLDELPRHREAGNDSPGIGLGGTVCKKCKKTSTIEHNGGRWCTNCGSFATPPDPLITARIKPRTQYEQHVQHKTLDLLHGRQLIRSDSSTCLHCGIAIALGSVLCDACD